MAAHTPTQATRELFSSYRARRWRADLPLAALHQWYENGRDTGAWQHVDFYALYVIRGGRGIHVINEHPYPIRRGDVYMTPPGSTHSYRDYRQLEAEVFCFQAPLFTDGELDALGALAGFRDMFIRGAGRRKGAARDVRMHLSAPQYHDVERMVEDVLDEMRRDEAISPAVVRGLLFRLLVYLARVHTQPPDAPAAGDGNSPAGSGVLAEILHVCETRFAEGLTVPQLAALVFLSPGHFSERFAREVGVPPATYLRRLRLEHAQELLRTTPLSITEIAQRSGFGDSAQLSRAFAVTLGITPRDYRRRFKV